MIGRRGPEGRPGPRGQQGLEGPEGRPGNPGATGATGERGLPGIGREGKQGVRGRDGATGGTGGTGATEGTGETGLPGRDGRDGSTGETGAMGCTGGTGATGQTGERGRMGMNGVVANDFSYIRLKITDADALSIDPLLLSSPLGGWCIMYNTDENKEISTIHLSTTDDTPSRFYCQVTSSKSIASLRLTFDHNYVDTELLPVSFYSNTTTVVATFMDSDELMSYVHDGVLLTLYVKWK